MLPTIVRRKQTVPTFVDEIFNDALFPKFLNWDISPRGTGIPAVNVEETDKDYYIEVAAPGLEKDDMKVVVNEGVLTISSEKKTQNEEKGENYIRREFGYSSFSRSFTLPEDVNSDKIGATQKNGVLRIQIPKTEPKVVPVKEIKIS
jgi:HSP20 family protein